MYLRGWLEPLLPSAQVRGYPDDGAKSARGLPPKD
jgi:hypothetical protein